ncbi:MAG: metal-dependent transcriptional regulator [Oscillospiraceae bacterium]
MEIKEAGENYLETIYIIGKRQGYCRAIDVCNELGYAKPTVSVTVHDFRDNGYLRIDPNGHITLTESGLCIAERMYERHELIAHALMALGVPEETAFRDSCKIEHDISEVSFEKIKAHYRAHLEK